MYWQITAFGKLFLVILIAMLLATLNYNNSLVYLLIFIFISLFILGFVKGWLNLFHLQLKSIETGDLFSQHPTLLKSKLQTHKHLVSKLVELELTDTKLKLNQIAGSATCEMTLTPPVRGPLKTPDLTISSTYPLGLFRWQKFIDLKAHTNQCLVYPQPIDFGVTPVQGSKGKNNNTADFDELVSWQQGEDLSGICWKTFARTGTKMKKQFSSVQEASDNTFEWQQLVTLSDEEKLSQLCFWIVEQHKHNHPFALSLPKQSFASRNDSQHYYQCLRALALFKTA